MGVRWTRMELMRYVSREGEGEVLRKRLMMLVLVSIAWKPPGLARVHERIPQ